mmetsp:Transcript_16115/g.47008  ORF Transcript_16115/g.47008 Transcript_16115/m.47008 type:complete len:235 (-) Transcript_16115:499-1203(-)
MVCPKRQVGPQARRSQDLSDTSRATRSFMMYTVRWSRSVKRPPKTKRRPSCSTAAWSDRLSSRESEEPLEDASLPPEPEVLTCSHSASRPSCAVALTTPSSVRAPTVPACITHASDSDAHISSLTWFLPESGTVTETRPPKTSTSASLSGFLVDGSAAAVCAHRAPGSHRSATSAFPGAAVAFVTSGSAGAGSSPEAGRAPSSSPKGIASHLRSRRSRRQELVRAARLSHPPIT